MPGHLLTFVLGFTLLQTTSVDVGKRMLQEQQWDEALKAFQTAVEENPDNGEAHYYLAQLYAYRGDEKNSIAHFREALRLLPEENVIWSEYGKWLLAQRYLQEAERVYRRLTSRDPAHSEYWMQLGLALYEGGKPDAALGAYDQGIRLNSASAQNYYLAGVAARSMGRFEDAKSYFLKGLAADPEHPEIHYQMGELLLERGHLRESLGYFEKLEAGHLPAVYSRGVVLLRLGDLTSAERLLRRVVEADEENTRAHYQLGLLYTRLGKKDLAEEFFRRFRKLEAQDRERDKTEIQKTIVEKPA